MEWKIDWTVSGPFTECIRGQGPESKVGQQVDSQPQLITIRAFSRVSVNGVSVVVQPLDLLHSARPH